MADGQRWQKEGGADQNFDYMFKLLIIGNSSVGKTSFLFRYADDSFTSAFVSTVGIDFKVKTVFRGDKRVKLQVCTFNLSNSRQDALHSLKCSRYFDHSCQYLFSPSSAPLLPLLRPSSRYGIQRARRGTGQSQRPITEVPWDLF